MTDPAAGPIAVDGAPSLRDRLRLDTADAHRALETALGLEVGIHDRAHVGRVLLALHDVFAVLEPALDAALGPALMAGRHRLPDLASDLVSLGLRPNGGGIDAPARLASAVSRDRDAMLGALYVTEGARLGGRLIGRAAARAPWYPAAGLRFWRDDPATGACWRSFLDWLDTATSDDAVIAGANHTFGLFRQRFSTTNAVPTPNGPLAETPRRG